MDEDRLCETARLNGWNGEVARQLLRKYKACKWSGRVCVSVSCIGVGGAGWRVTIELQVDTVVGWWAAPHATANLPLPVRVS